MATHRPHNAVLPDVITYRLASNLVYVRPTDDYEVKTKAYSLWKT